MNRVCFVSIYFGKEPNFFKEFFASCKWNDGFDWLLIHDSKLDCSIPQNVQTIQMTMKEFIQEVNIHTGIVIDNIKPYKVCDFRPAFGEIFFDYLKKYEFWGISDTDMLLGNLANFIDNDLLDNFDKIYTVGHLSIIRNTKVINSIYKLSTQNSRNYQDVFLNPLSCVYDEYQGFTEKFIDLGYRVYKEKECADTTMVFGRIDSTPKFLIGLIQPQNKYIQYCNDRNYPHQIFVLDRGKIYKIFIGECQAIQKREYTYIHKIVFSFGHPITENSRLIITKDGYIEDKVWFEKYDKGQLTAKDLDKYNHRHWMKQIYVSVYKFVRLKIRKIRKKYFPREHEI